MASVAIVAATVLLVEALALRELLVEPRAFVTLGWLGVACVLAGSLASTGKRWRPQAYGLLVGGFVALTIFAAPSRSAAIPLAAILAPGIAHPRRPIRATTWIGVVLGVWLIALGIANGFNRSWSAGAPLALLSTVTPEASLRQLFDPLTVLDGTVFRPALSVGPFRTEDPGYRLLVLASVFGPLMGGVLLWIPRTRRLASWLFLPVAIVVAWAGWDPALLMVAAAGCLLILVLPTTWDSDNAALRTTFYQRFAAGTVFATILLWPHAQRYLVAEYNVDGRAYYGQNDHGYVGWANKAELRVGRDGEMIALRISPNEPMGTMLATFQNRATRSGEFVDRQPLAEALRRAYPGEDEYQIGTSRMILDPRHQRIARVGRDFSYKARPDGRYFRSVYRYIQRFDIDAIEGATVPPL